jgi:hypothetical protein
MKCQGREANWFWRWKFLTADRHVRFDPDKFGWPWVPHTCSWVVPTACAILALSQVPCSCGGLEDIPLRVDLGIEMLMDRACPEDGMPATGLTACCRRGYSYLLFEERRIAGIRILLEVSFQLRRIFRSLHAALCSKAKTTRTL